MIESLFSSTAIPVMEHVAQFAQARHEVLAGNVANIDTPGYRTRDLSVDQFQGRLKRAISERDKSPGHTDLMSATQRNGSFSDVKEGLNAILHHDDSNVGVEQQVTEMVKNQQQHNLAMSVLTNQFRLLQVAISERA